MQDTFEVYFAPAGTLLNLYMRERGQLELRHVVQMDGYRTTQRVVFNCLIQRTCISGCKMYRMVFNRTYTDSRRAVCAVV